VTDTRHPAIFLDRDGTIIEDAGFSSKAEQIRILAGTVLGLRRLAHAGFKLVVVTNQSGIARGLFTEDDLTRFHEALDQQLNLLGVRVDAYYVCPHHPDPAEATRKELGVDCACRKPKPGMLLRAAEDMRLDLGASWLVGDSWRDILAGQAAGVRTVKIPHVPPERERPRPPECQPPTAEAANLDDAADVILRAKDSAPAPEAPPEPETPATAEPEPPAPEAAAPPPPPVEEVTAPEAPPADLAPPEPEAPPVEPLAEALPPEPPPEPEPAPTPPVAPAPETEPPRPPARPAPAVEGTCARCAADVLKFDVEHGTAGRHDGLLLCGECLKLQAKVAAPRPTAGGEESAALMRELLSELRRLTRARQAAGLSFLRMLAYILQIAALFFAAVMPFIVEFKMPGQDKMVFLQIAILLQLLVVTLLVLERKS